MVPVMAEVIVFQSVSKNINSCISSPVHRGTRSGCQGCSHWTECCKEGPNSRDNSAACFPGPLARVASFYCCLYSAAVVTTTETKHQTNDNSIN